MKDNRDKLKYSSEDFAKMVTGKFPILRKKIAKTGDFIYSQAGDFAIFINDAIRTADFKTVTEALAFAENMYNNGDETILNAFQCDFFEVLDLRGSNGMKVYCQMSKVFQDKYKKAQLYIGRPFPFNKT